MKSAIRRAGVALCAMSLLLYFASPAVGKRRYRPAKHQTTLHHRDNIALGPSKVLRSGPGDSFKVVRELVAGSSVVILGVKGRWARVRAGRTKGWMLRRSLEGYLRSLGQAQHGNRNKKRVWSGVGTRSSFRVTVDRDHVEIRASASPLAGSLGGVLRGERLQILGRDKTRTWLRVRSEEGLEGWVPTRVLKSDAMPQAEQDSLQINSHRLDDPTTWNSEDLRRFEITTRVNLGYRSLSMDFSSNGRGPLGNTIVDSQAVAVDGEIDAVLRTVNRRQHLGFDARFRVSYSNPGIEVIRHNAAIGDVGFSVYESGAGVRGGMVLGDFEIAARTGLRYDVFFTKELSNIGQLPRESLFSVVAGARIDWYRFAPNLIFEAAGQILVAGMQHQTVGMEDGSQTRVSGGEGELRVRVRLSSAMDFVSSLQYGWMQYEWSGPSTRNPDVMSSARSDSSQHLAMGLAYRF